MELIAVAGTGVTTRVLVCLLLDEADEAAEADEADEADMADDEADSAEDKEPVGSAENFVSNVVGRAGV